MTVANVSQGSVPDLPDALRTAQAAIDRPEVQEMLCRLSEYKLGIFMPHMHDEQTGEFQPLPDNVMQVESGLVVSFQPMDEIANQTDRFLPVGWCWRAGASTPVAACEMVREEGHGDTEPHVKHTMLKATGQGRASSFYTDKDELPISSGLAARISNDRSAEAFHNMKPV